MLFCSMYFHSCNFLYDFSNCLVPKKSDITGTLLPLVKNCLTKTTPCTTVTMYMYIHASLDLSLVPEPFLAETIDSRGSGSSDAFNLGE